MSHGFAGAGQAWVGAALALLACLLPLAIGGSSGCGPDDLPLGVLPGQTISYAPTHATTTTSGTTPAGGSITITALRPLVGTTPTAETTLTVSGSGFGTDPTKLGFQTQVAAVADTVMSTTVGRTSLTPHNAVATVATASANQITVLLPSDTLGSSTVTVGVRGTPITSSDGSTIIPLTNASNSLPLVLKPVIIQNQTPTGVLAPGNTVTLLATGLTATLSDHHIHFQNAANADVAVVALDAIEFEPGSSIGHLGQRPKITFTAPRTISFDHIVLDVQGRRSDPFR